MCHVTWVINPRFNFFCQAVEENVPLMEQLPVATVVGVYSIQRTASRFTGDNITIMQSHIIFITNSNNNNVSVKGLLPCK